MPYLFTSESVSEGHPDKVADQISDAILDAMLAQDPDSRVACETMVTTGLVVVAGEVTTKAYVDIPGVVRKTIAQIGYTKAEYQFEAESCGVINALHSQSPDIAQGVDEREGKEQGAGDQGMMFGYATRETPEFMPMALAFSHRLVKELARIRKEEPELMPYLRPDAKAQVTIEYSDDNQPVVVDTIVVSTQHDDFIKPDYAAHPDTAQGRAAAVAEADEKILSKIKKDIIEKVIPSVIPQTMLSSRTKYHINPTGKFVIGGPHGDAGLTGRKIIVDTYGGKGAHGGGAFSGKDSSKVDRSAAYAARHIAKNMVAAGLCDEVLVQVAYAIGVAQPVSLTVNTYGTAKVDMKDGQIASKIKELFDMRPRAIVERLGLKNPIFSESAAYGHMGREAAAKEVGLEYVRVRENGTGEKEEVRRKEKKSVEFFTWEKLDYVDKIKAAFGL
ncbi:S-adenosylmethionine synthetase [Catalinimonas alkaloidigena]|uniref:S-adenosylmethionine synthase n=1 Tax=Catalinimonas alkaloidigena TaxID=1075417 RepID=A0A1G9MLZ9_9BACT|nr:methionine adenosyltransferase [Catalinimonas alkaloidigena]SDL75093.1 S-adenosylmethionine synthetase [Catalinimonas alkaloidigena]